MTPLIVALILTGAGLLVAEAHVASYGALGAAGVLALVLAAVLAVGEAGGGAVAALAVAIPVAVVLGGLVVIAARKSLAVRNRRALGGAEGLIGRSASCATRARRRARSSSLASSGTPGAPRCTTRTRSPSCTRASASWWSGCRG